jgi:hypothetical protein
MISTKFHWKPRKELFSFSAVVFIPNKEVGARSGEFSDVPLFHRGMKIAAHSNPTGRHGVTIWLRCAHRSG